MSREKLTESLLDKRDARARAIWREAEQRLHRYRQEVEDLCLRRRRETEARARTSLGQKLDKLQSRIDKQRMRIRLQAEEGFSTRLHQLAMARLAALPTQQRSETLRRLANELPEQEWQSLVVHPDDRRLAQELFPGCRIDSDPRLAGGLTAASADGDILVDNSLAGRLDLVWPRLCGSLLDTLQSKRESDDVEPAV